MTPFLFIAAGKLVVASINVHAFFVTLPLSLGLMLVIKMALDGIFEELPPNN